ncbi:TPA: glycerophosphoryl diester phosphodiesterase membrane domain-containing protein [Streptococcus suis]
MKTGKKVSTSWAFRGRTVWLFTKYQLLSKGLLALVIYPLYSLAIDTFLGLSGRTGISSGDYLSFLFSFQGLGFLLVTLLLMVILIGLDINTFILTSALIKEGKIEMTARHMLWLGLTSLKSLFSPAGLLLMVYVSLIFPLLGLGVTIGPMRQFQIPNFITSVIYANPLYLSLYAGVLLILAYLSYRFLFTFHYVLIDGQGIRQALASSLALTKKQRWGLIKRLVGIFLKNGLLYFVPLVIALIVLLVFVLVSQAEHTNQSRLYLLFILLAVLDIINFLTFLFPPMMIYLVTDAFYDCEEAEGRSLAVTLPTKASKWREDILPTIRLRTKFLVTSLILLILAGNFGLAYVLVQDFDTIFRVHHKIELVAHRGGGDLGAENTVAGILAAAEEGVAWSEIDIQRTKDGHYVLNHDGDFQRVAGDSRSSSEMTLAEIQELQVADAFDTSRPAQPVPTIEEVIEASKGKIGLFIELKGKTADKQMVDDIVAMVKSYGVEKEVALLSLDYSLITYIEETYPEMDSGYLYYFSIGQTGDLQGDYLIMEEAEASLEKVADLKAQGKKVIVWTVNTEESIQRFVNSEVDGIITDYVLDVKAGIKARDERTDFDVIVDSVLGE